MWLLARNLLMCCNAADVFQLPPKPSDQSQSSSSAATAAYNPYSPAVVATAPQTNAPPAPVNIGFENLSSTSLPSHFIIIIIINIIIIVIITSFAAWAIDDSMAFTVYKAMLQQLHSFCLVDYAQLELLWKNQPLNRN